jgi:hypothetical protein
MQKIMKASKVTDLTKKFLKKCEKLGDGRAK